MGESWKEELKGVESRIALLAKSVIQPLTLPHKQCYAANRSSINQEDIFVYPSI
jgi:hypothetical protein